ncbi:MAG: methionyl-tRNA formyltransferase, partial [Verrucomicrobiota bacterium]|nr:methionyl-tRNA formyltransferase [Verrucomicrobiota bacterium]
MNPSKQIVFFGSDSICLPILNYLNTDCSDLCQLRAVISQPDRRQGRGKKYQPNVVSQWAISNSVELLQPEIPDEALANWLIDKQVLASVVMAYGHYLPRFIREATPLGMVNLHGSLLPRYRGASPIETALSSGDSTTGVCLMQVGPQMDAGGVADTEKVRIEQFDTSISLRKKM